MKKYYIIFFNIVGLISSVLFLLSSCTSAKTVNLLQDKEPIYASRPFIDYKLQYNDEIYCSVITANTEFSNEFNYTNIISTSGGQGTAYTIFANGNISIPFFGEIHIVGRTIPEAEQIIQARMQQAFPDAQVKVALRNNVYYVVSDERTGSQQLYKDNTTIFQALAMNGRPSSRMDLGKVKIIRYDGTGKSVVKQFDMRSESIIESEFYYIKPNDVIYYTTSKNAFFRIHSFQSLLSTLALPISIIGTILATTVN